MTDRSSEAAEKAPRLRLRLRERPAPLTLLALVIAACCALPVFAVVLAALVDPSASFAHLMATVVPAYVGNTMALVLIVGVGATLIGVGTAWFTTLCEFPGRRLFDWALILPLAVPAYVMAYAYTDFLQVSGPVQSLLRALFGLSVGEYWFPRIRSLEGAALMLVLVLYPYVYLLARASFLEQSASAFEASRSLGLGPWASFWRIALPLARPAIAGGVALALMETLADFGTVSYFGVQTFTTGIYRAWFSMGDPVAASRLATLLLTAVLVVLVLERLSRGRARTQHAGRRQTPPQRFVLQGPRAALAWLACALPLVLGFILPTLILLHLALGTGELALGASFAMIVLNSALLAATAAILTVLIALMLVYAARSQPTGLTRTSVAVAGLGYAVPGSIIAVGILVPLAAFDRTFDQWTRDVFGVGSGLVLTGTIAGLVYAFVVRFLAIAIQTLDQSFARIPQSRDDAARALGSGPLATMWRVHLTPMKASLLTAGLIVFVDVLKELPASLLMRPFDFTTLAIAAHNFAADERLGEAAGVALVIVAAALAPVVLLALRIRAAPLESARATPPSARL